MSKINLQRLLLGALLAGVISFFGDGLIHGLALKASWTGLLTAAGKKQGGGSDGFGIFLAYDLARALVSMFIYAGFRPRFGPGPATAVVAGLTTWVLCIPIALVGLAPMEFFPMSHVLTWSALGAVVIVLSSLAGAAVYKE